MSKAILDSAGPGVEQECSDIGTILFSYSLTAFILKVMYFCSNKKTNLTHVKCSVWFVFAVNSKGFKPRPMIITSGGQLPSRHIIHIVGQKDPAAIKDIVYSVLKVCEENKLGSVAFPALGTGQ